MNIKEMARPTVDQPQIASGASVTLVRLRRQWIWILSAIAFLAVCGAGAQLSGMFKQKEPAKAVAPVSVPVLTVRVQPATVQPIDRSITVNGSISAWDPISVGAEASGLEITGIMVEEGAVVKKGQILATLNSSLIRPQLESEEARLKASLASASKARQPNRPEDINGLSAAVSQAQATVADQEAALVQAQANVLNAEQNVTRYAYLQKEGAVSVQELENRQTTAKVDIANVHSAEEKVKAARFSLKQAQEKLSMAQIGGRNEDIQIADANINEIQGNIKRYQAQIVQTVIRAPVDGTITRRDAHIGDISTAGKAMFMMSRDSRLELRAQVPETDLCNVKAGELVSIRSPLSGNEEIKGRVRVISPMVDSDTRLATVRIDIPNHNGVQPGMYAAGSLAVGKCDAVTVSPQAVVSEDDKSFVFVLHGDKVETRPVVVGTRTNDLVEIKSGLRANESVVVQGAGFLKDGDCVAVAK